MIIYFVFVGRGIFQRKANGKYSLVFDPVPFAAEFYQKKLCSLIRKTLFLNDRLNGNPILIFCDDTKNELFKSEGMKHPFGVYTRGTTKHIHMRFTNLCPLPLFKCSTIQFVPLSKWGLEQRSDYHALDLGSLNQTYG